MAASNAEENMERFKGENHSAFVVGYTGATGKALVSDLNNRKLFKKVVLIGRREVPLDVGKEFEQKIVDFENLEDSGEVFDNLDVGFCCLGPNSSTGGRRDFVKVDRDYIISIATAARARGCKQFSLVSALGVSIDSKFAQLRAKAEAIEGVKALSFDRSSIYKPGNLLAKRQDFRLYEAVVNRMLKPFYYCFPTAISIPVETLARAMVHHVVEPMPREAQNNVYGNKDAHVAAGVSSS